MGLYHSPRIVTDSLVTYFDAGNTKSYPGTGTSFYDITNLSRVGTLINSPTYSSGTLTFSKASSQYVSIPDSDTFSFTNNIFSINFWVRFTNTTANQGVFAKTNVLWEYSAYIQTSGTLVFNAWTSGGSGVYATSVATNASTWYNYCWTADGTNAYLYVNGALTTTVAKTAGNNMSNTNSLLYLGAGGNASTGLSYLDGQLSNFNLYSKCLSGTEVLQNFNAIRGRFGI